MNYVHNKADVIRAFIFVQTELKGFAIYSPVEFNYNNDERKMNIVKITAKEQAAKVQQQLEDKEALGIVEVEVFTDLNKEKTLEMFCRIKEDSIKFTQENNSSIGLFFVGIGFKMNSE